MKIILLLCVGIFWIFLSAPPPAVADIQSRCGDRLSTAIETGMEIQELKKQKRRVIRDARTRARRGATPSDYARRKAGEIDREISQLRRAYDNASQQYAQCVEAYKRDLKSRRRSGEASRSEWDNTLQQIRDNMKAIRTAWD